MTVGEGKSIEREGHEVYGNFALQYKIYFAYIPDPKKLGRYVKTEQQIKECHNVAQKHNAFC